jgi:hypothetical protein
MPGGPAHGRKVTDSSARSYACSRTRNHFCASFLIRRQGGRFPGDLMLPLDDRELVVEVKHHGSSFKAGRDLLLIKTENKEVLVVVPLRLATEIIKLAIPLLQRT